MDIWSELAAEGIDKALIDEVVSRVMRKFNCRLRLSEVSRQ